MNADSIPELKAQLAAAVQERDMARALTETLIRLSVGPLETQLDEMTAQRDRLWYAHERVCEGLLAAIDERDRARACAVALEQELAQITVPSAATRPAPAGGTAPTEETTP